MPSRMFVVQENPPPPSRLRRLNYGEDVKLASAGRGFRRNAAEERFHEEDEQRTIRGEESSHLGSNLYEIRWSELKREK